MQKIYALWTLLIFLPGFAAAERVRTVVPRATLNYLSHDAECAIVLRRCADIGMGRAMDLDGVPRADQLPPMMTGVCYTMQPGVIEHAVRHVGSIRDFSARPEAFGDSR